MTAARPLARLIDSPITDSFICLDKKNFRRDARSCSRRRTRRRCRRDEEEIDMRKTVAGLFVSVDNVVEAPEKWTGPYFGPQVGGVVGSLVAGGDTLLLGRVTYETFAASFAGDTGGDPMAAQMNAFEKVVVSTTLERAEWQNSTLVNGDVEAAVTELKQREGRNINLSGSATLVAWLLRHGLLDELHLLVFPVVVGEGRRLFDGGGSPVPLTLVAHEAFDSGVLHLEYHCA
jgi:dihydrofolate reductase